MDFISFLNENTGAIQTVSAGVVAIATAIYVVYTAGMFRQMRYSNRRLEAANVQALLEPGRSRGSLFELAIKNSGNVSVYNVSVNVDPEDFPSLTEQKLNDLSLFSKPIPVLTEGQEIRTLLFHYQDYVESATGDTIAFSVSFKTPQGKTETSTYTYDLSIYKGLTDFSEKSLNDITAELKNLNKEIKRVSSRLKDIDTALEWSAKLPAEHSGEPELSTTLDFFLACWEDYKSLEDEANIGFGLYKIKMLCERVHDELCRNDGRSSGYEEVRQNLLRMSRKRFYLDGGKSVREFESLGDETTNIMRRLKGAG